MTDVGRSEPVRRCWEVKAVVLGDGRGEGNNEKHTSSSRDPVVEVDDIFRGMPVDGVQNAGLVTCQSVQKKRRLHAKHVDRRSRRKPSDGIR